MARIGGRNLWIAVPAGLACAAVVGALVYLAQPMVPVAVAWVGETLRTATAQGRQAEAAGAESPALTATDCRGIYPDGLWAELTLRGDTLLHQDASAPATTVAGVVEALAPSVRMTCRWSTEDGELSTTLSTVSPDAVDIAQAALQGSGFACSTTGALVDCTRTEGDVVENHALDGTLWLVTVERGWSPDDYAGRIVAFVWGEG